MSASFDCASLSGAHQPMAYCCTVQMSYVSYRLVIQWASLYLASDRRALSDYVRLLSSCCYFAARFIGSSFIFFFFVNSRCACVYYAYVMHGLYCFMHNLSRSCCRVFGSQYACERRPKLLRSGKNGIFLFGGIFFFIAFCWFRYHTRYSVLRTHAIRILSIVVGQTDCVVRATRHRGERRI